MADDEEDSLQSLAEVTFKPLEWAWQGMIPRGKLSLLTGDPGVGKSLVALQIAAMVSRGDRLPPGISEVAASTETEAIASGEAKSDGNENVSSNAEPRPQAVVLLSAEDAVDDTILPRLMGAGADLSKVFHWREPEFSRQPPAESDGDKTADKSADPSFRLSRHLPRFEASLKRIQEKGLELGLIVIDPIDRYFGPADKKKDRIEVIRKLVHLAARTGAAVLVIANTSWKAGNGSASAIIQEITNSARSVLMVAQDLEDETQRMVLPVKMNLSATPPGAIFTIEDGVVRWKSEPITMTGDQYVTQARVKLKNPLVREEVYEIQRVTNWLRDELTPGRASSIWVRHRAASYDIAYGTLRRAFKNLGCWTSKEGKMWFWHLPGHQGQASEEERNTMVEYPNGDAVGVYRETVPYWLAHQDEN